MAVAEETKVRKHNLKLYPRYLMLGLIYYFIMVLE